MKAFLFFIIFGLLFSGVLYLAFTVHIIYAALSSILLPLMFIFSAAMFDENK